MSLDVRSAVWPTQDLILGSSERRHMGVGHHEAAAELDSRTNHTVLRNGGSFDQLDVICEFGAWVNISRCSKTTPTECKQGVVGRESP